MTVEEKLEECCLMLDEAKTDEDLMIALTILPSQLNNTPEQMEKAFTHIPWNFIHRLLLSREEEDMFQQIGVHIFTSFCQKPFINSKKYLKRLLPLSSVLSTTNDTELQKQIIDSILTIAISDPIQLTPSIIQNIIQVKNSELFLDLITSMLTLQQTISPLFLTKTLAIFENDEFKLKALDVSIMLFSSSEIEVEAETLIGFKNVIKQMISSKLNKSLVQKLLTISSLLSFHKHFLENTYQNGALSNEQFIVMLTHLVCAEIRVTLDTITVLSQNPTLQLHYSLLENIIFYLVTTTDSFDQKNLGSIRKAMSETYLAVAAFLSERWDIFQTTREIESIDNFVTVFSFRTYCNWISEESSVSIDELERLIPLVIEILKTEFDPYDVCIELLTTITSEELTLDAFVDAEGDKVVIEYCLGVLDYDELANGVQNITLVGNQERNALKSNVKQLIETVFINTIVSSGMNGDSILVKNFDKYKSLIKVLEYFLRTENDTYFVAHCLTEKAFEFVMKRVGKDFHTDVKDLWQICASVLYDCIPVGLEKKDKARFIKGLEAMRGLEGDDLEVVERLITKLNI